MYNNIEGFLNNPFFRALKTDLKKEDIERIIKKEVNSDQTDLILSYLLDEFRYKYKEIQNRFLKDYQELMKEVLLDFLAEEDVFRFFVDNEEDNIKIKNLIKRKQYNAKLINQILSKVTYFIYKVADGSIQKTNLVPFLYRDITKKINEFNDEYVLRELNPLKVIVDKVTSGVKAECYLDFSKGDKDRNKCSNAKELEEYIFQKHGYRYLYKFGWNNHFSLLFGYQTDDIVLSLAVINDKDFWEFNTSNNKTFLSFVFLVAKYNDLSHAKKLIDYAFEQVCTDPICKYLYDHKLGLYISLNPHERIINYCTHRLEHRLASVTKREIEKSDYRGFLFPLYEGYESQVLKGNEIFTNFIKKAYPENFKDVFKIFQNPDTIIQDEVNENHNHKRMISLKNMLEAEYLGYDEKDEIHKFMYGYYENFGSTDSILGRMYYRCYIIDKLTGSISNECLYELFFNIFEMIETKFGIQCSYTINHELRNQNYELLKNILKKYGFDLNDSYKKEYITALLDRKYASFEEVDLFPQLEQFGDAIYELAVDNIFFYNPNTVLNHESRESLVKAEAQNKVSKKIGLNNLYISNLHNSLNSKYLDYEMNTMGLENQLHGNYIADLLEMIIGVLAREFGVQRALDFTTKIILETNPDLETPKILKFDIVDLFNTLNEKEYSETFEDVDYLNKIYPGPFCMGDNGYDGNYREYDILRQALKKILSICIIGNDTKEKRIAISNEHKLLNLSREFQFVASYLYYGIETTIEKYRPLIKSDF